MTTKTKLFKIIHKHCLECCGGISKDVEKCTASPGSEPAYVCGLWPYRMGKDPSPNSARIAAGKKHGVQNLKNIE